MYFPVFFSQYAPRCNPNLNVTEENGFWRIHSYGMAAIHVHDYSNTDGFDLTIIGWGLEDLAFADTVIKNGLGHSSKSVMIVHQNLDFSTKFGFFHKIWIFHQNFVISPQV